MKSKIYVVCVLYVSLLMQPLKSESPYLPVTAYAFIKDMPHIYRHMVLHKSPSDNVARVCDYVSQEQEIPLDLVKASLNEVMDFFAQLDNVRCAHGGEQVPIAVSRPSTSAGCIVNGCQPGPLRIGTDNPTSLTLATNGCSDRIVIDENGAVLVNMPTAGEALTVNGNIVVPIVNAAGTQGIVKLGGTGPQRVNVYESGSQNFFAGAGAINSVVTGTSNISIGTTANSTLTTANNTIAIGTNAQATGTDSVVLGDSANSTFARTIVVGSADSTSTGVAPTAGALNAIAIGSASGTLAGASAAGLAAIALGGSGGTFSGATASGDRSVAIGINATSSSTMSIAVGSASGTAGGIGATASTNINTIAIGSASGANRGALATGISAIALGGSDGTIFTGASAIGDRSVAIGVSATTLITGTSAIAIGSASGTAGGFGATASSANAIAIGSANATQRGALASGFAALAVGGSDAVFPGAVAAGDRSVAIGVNATTLITGTGAIALGSASGVAGGAAATANRFNAIAIGSARGARRGALASGDASLAIGGSDDINFTGASAIGDRSIAIGVSATTLITGTSAIAIGSASGTVGGSGPSANNQGAIAIGSANAAQRGALASGLASVALGGSDGTSTGATASGDRSVAIGCGANTAQADAILLGNAASTAVRVGIGIAAPAAKLDIVGVNGTPVIRFNQVDPSIANAPTWLNPSTSGSPGTAIHFNASGQLFGLTSSKRYKTNIRPITHESEIIYDLNPTLYDAKEGYGVGKDIPGFIAEEVYEVAPNLVVLNEHGEPENVAYNSLHALAIKELQKQQQCIDEQSILCKKQEDKLKRLSKCLARLRKKLLELQDADVSTIP